MKIIFVKSGSSTVLMRGSVQLSGCGWPLRAAHSARKEAPLCGVLVCVRADTADPARRASADDDVRRTTHVGGGCGGRGSSV